jgi:hypothetical protein
MTEINAAISKARAENRDLTDQEMTAVIADRKLAEAAADTALKASQREQNLGSPTPGHRKPKRTLPPG